jgi:glycosyltransferase 2 family protein
MRGFWRLGLKCLLTGAVAWYLLSKVPLAAVGHVLKGTAPAWMGAAIALQIVIRIVNAIRIRIIARAQGVPLSAGAILSVLFTSAFYGLLLPGSIGGGAATLVKYVGRGATLAAALASMVVNRLLETLTVVSLGAFFWGLEHRDGPDVLTARIAIILLVSAPLLLIGGHLLLFGRVRLLERIAQLARPYYLKRERILQRGFGAVLEQCAQAGNLTPPAAVGVFSLSVTKELLSALSAWCFAQGVGVDLRFISVAWMQDVVALLILLPITVSGLGVREGALVLVTRPYGIEPAQALSWGVVQFGGLLAMALIGALIEARALWLTSARS